MPFSRGQGRDRLLERLGRLGNINAYIGWVGDELRERYGVKLVHVKLDDTANAVATVVTEKAAGKDENGAIDLIWINGENFASMKRQGLLFGPDWAQQLPNWQYVDAENQPTITTDFTIPTDGMESPWGMAKLVFFHDSARTVRRPARFRRRTAAMGEGQSRPVLLSAAAGFHRFLLSEAGPVGKDRRSAKLLQPVEAGEFAELTKPLFDYLDDLHPTSGVRPRLFRRITRR
jgi:putative thiamine transport system substrate-binding protein